jgi:hypothetical protein
MVGRREHGWPIKRRDISRPNPVARPAQKTVLNQAAATELPRPDIEGWLNTIADQKDSRNHASRQRREGQ